VKRDDPVFDSVQNQVGVGFLVAGVPLLRICARLQSVW